MKAKVAKRSDCRIDALKWKINVCVKNTDQYNNSFTSSKLVFGRALQTIVCPFSLDESWFWKKGERVFFQHHDHCNNELQKL